MLRSKQIAIIGSFRAGEVSKFRFRPILEHAFGPACEALGEELTKAGHRICVAWSNDHVAAQHMNRLYTFRDTADFHALVGAMRAVAANSGVVHPPLVFVSKTMWEVGSGEELDTPVSALELSGKLLKDWLSDGKLLVEFIDGTLLRTDMLDDYIVPRCDIVFGVGGGKATRAAGSAAEQKGTLIPIPYFGGIMSSTFDRLIAENSSASNQIRRSYSRVGLSYGHQNALEIEQAMRGIGRDMSPNGNSQVRVFLAMPFSDSVDLIPPYSEADVYDAVRSGIDDLDGKVCALKLVRIDREGNGLAGNIPDRIQEEIRKCDFFVADVTEIDNPSVKGSPRPNANVWWEFGYATALGKPILLLARKNTVLPFNVRVVNTVFWKDTETIRQSVRRALQAFCNDNGLHC